MLAFSAMGIWELNNFKMLGCTVLLLLTYATKSYSQHCPQLDQALEDFSQKFEAIQDKNRTRDLEQIDTLYSTVHPEADLKDIALSIISRYYNGTIDIEATPPVLNPNDQVSPFVFDEKAVGVLKRDLPCYGKRLQLNQLIKTTLVYAEHRKRMESCNLERYQKEVRMSVAQYPFHLATIPHKPDIRTPIGVFDRLPGESSADEFIELMTRNNQMDSEQDPSYVLTNYTHTSQVALQNLVKLYLRGKLLYGVDKHTKKASEVAAVPLFESITSQTNWREGDDYKAIVSEIQDNFCGLEEENPYYYASCVFSMEKTVSSFFTYLQKQKQADPEIAKSLPELVNALNIELSEIRANVLDQFDLIYNFFYDGPHGLTNKVYIVNVPDEGITNLMNEANKQAIELAQDEIQRDITERITSTPYGMYLFTDQLKFREVDLKVELEAKTRGVIAEARVIPPSVGPKRKDVYPISAHEAEIEEFLSEEIEYNQKLVFNSIKSTQENILERAKNLIKTRKKIRRQLVANGYKGSDRSYGASAKLDLAILYRDLNMLYKSFPYLIGEVMISAPREIPGNCHVLQRVGQWAEGEERRIRRLENISFAISGLSLLVGGPVGFFAKSVVFKVAGQVIASVGNTVAAGIGGYALYRRIGQYRDTDEITELARLAVMANLNEHQNLKYLESEVVGQKMQIIMDGGFLMLEALTVLKIAHRWGWLERFFGMNMSKIIDDLPKLARMCKHNPELRRSMSVLLETLRGGMKRKEWRKLLDEFTDKLSKSGGEDEVYEILQNGFRIDDEIIDLTKSAELDKLLQYIDTDALPTVILKILSRSKGDLVPALDNLTDDLIEVIYDQKEIIYKKVKSKLGITRKKKEVKIVKVRKATTYEALRNKSDLSAYKIPTLLEEGGRKVINRDFWKNYAKLDSRTLDRLEETIENAPEMTEAFLKTMTEVKPSFLDEFVERGDFMNAINGIFDGDIVKLLASFKKFNTEKFVKRMAELTARASNKSLSKTKRFKARAEIAFMRAKLTFRNSLGKRFRKLHKKLKKIEGEEDLVVRQNQRKLEISKFNDRTKCLSDRQKGLIKSSLQNFYGKLAPKISAGTALVTPFIVDSLFSDDGVDAETARKAFVESFLQLNVMRWIGMVKGKTLQHKLGWDSLMHGLFGYATGFLKGQGIYPAEMWVENQVSDFAKAHGIDLVLQDLAEKTFARSQEPDVQRKLADFPGSPDSIDERVIMQGPMQNDLYRAIEKAELEEETMTSDGEVPGLGMFEGVFALANTVRIAYTTRMISRNLCYASLRPSSEHKKYWGMKNKIHPEEMKGRRDFIWISFAVNFAYFLARDPFLEYWKENQQQVMDFVKKLEDHLLNKASYTVTE